MDTMLKTFVFLCLVAVVTCQLSLPPEDMRKVIQYNTECQRQSSATNPEIMATIQGRFSNSPALKAHMLCMGRKLNFISQDGQLQRNVIRSKMLQVVPDEGKVDSLMNKCLNERGTPTDTAYEGIKCISDNRSMITGK